MNQNRLGSCSYDLDRDFRITAVDAAWSDFAAANGAPELIPPLGPLGESALACCADRTTAALYQQLFSRVQRLGKPVVIPFRCDSPTLRRFLELRVEALASGALRLRSTLLRVEERPAIPLVQTLGARSAEFLRMCSFCKRVEVGLQWWEVEEAVVRLRLMDDTPLPSITHGVCPDCYAATLATLEEA